MRFYRIHITSKHYELHSHVTLVADDEEKAKKMAGDRFHELVQSFMDGPIKSPTVNPTVINKELLLKDAEYKIIVTSTPTILTAEWSKTK